MYEVVGLLQQRNTHWKFLTPAIRRTIMLNTVKKANIREMNSPAKWLKLFIANALKAFNSGYLSHFLQSNANMIPADIPQQVKTTMNEQFSPILQHLDTQPDILMELCQSE